MAAQSHRSNGPRGPTTAGPPESSSQRGLPRSVPATNCLVMGTREDMTSTGKIHVRVGHSWIGILLFAFTMLLLSANPARADDRCVADLGGVIDGFVTPNPPAQIQIDGNCIIRNFPASNPLRTNFSFLTQPGQTTDRWL